MKINLNEIDTGECGFIVKPCIVDGCQFWLVNPGFAGVAWTEKNLIFRSSLFDASGELVSAGFKKFFNDNERPDIYPFPDTLSSVSVIEKIDGSCLICSLINGKLNLRTRGTSDAHALANGSELDLFEKQYPIERALRSFGQGISLIFEWTSPLQKIVIDYGERPDIVLTGAIRLENYSYFTQDELDELALKFGFRRPKRYFFSTVTEMIQTVSAFSGLEGVCAYYGNDQHIRKFKSVSYLTLHRMKSDVASVDKVIDAYLSHYTAVGKFSTYNEFIDYLTNTFDFEIAQMARGHVSTICDGMKLVAQIEAGMRVFANKVIALPPKERAEHILQAYGNTSRASFVFSLVNGKPWSEKEYKKLLYQVLKR